MTWHIEARTGSVRLQDYDTHATVPRIIRSLRGGTKVEDLEYLHGSRLPLNMSHIVEDHRSSGSSSVHEKDDTEKGAGSFTFSSNRDNLTVAPSCR